jgi:HEAT repeat protein
MEALDTEARALIGRLNNLHEIFRVQGEILSHGEDIVEPLAAFLLSEPSTFPEPRVAAAECLGAIGGDQAVEALILVLDHHDLQQLRPVQRFAEETVRNAAARRLTRFCQTEVIEALLSSLRRDHLIGAGQALAALGDVRAIPYLIDCLEDDYKKEKAMEALRQFDQIAVSYLCEAVERPRFVEGVEPPLSQERRSRAAELLGQLKARDALPALEGGLHDDSDTVRTACAVTLGGLGIAPQEVVSQLIAGLEHPDLIVRTDCEGALQNIGNQAMPLLAQAASGQAIHFRENEFRLSLNGRLVATKILGMSPDGSAALCLIKQLKDPEEIMRYRTVVALENSSDPDVRAALDQVAHNDPSRKVRMRAREALQRSGKRNAVPAI